MAQKFKHIVRIKNTNLEGDKKVDHALTGIDGIGKNVAKAIIKDSEVDPNERIGKLSEDEIEEINQAIENFDSKAPGWMVNRQKDYETGEDKHLLGSKVEVAERQDKDRMKKISSYKGVRHKRGQKVRGQKTRSTGRGGKTVGVKRSEIQPEEKEEE